MGNPTMIDVFRAFGDPVRWTIVNELRQGTRCACLLRHVAQDPPYVLK